MNEVNFLISQKRFVERDYYAVSSEIENVIL